MKINAYQNITDAHKFEIIKKSKLLVTASMYEGFGVSPCEAFFCDRPVIAYDLPVSKEIYGEAICYAPRGNVKQLGILIEKLLNDSKLREAKAKEGHDRIRGHLELSSVSKKLANIVKSVALPQFSICVIALNEEANIGNVLRNFYDWECCKQIIIVEGAVDLYPDRNVRADGGSTDRTVDIISQFPDPQHKIVLVRGKWKDKMHQRSQYAQRVTGDYMWVVDADECYTKADLETIKNEVMEKRDVEIWSFRDAKDPKRRGIIHFWHGINKHVVGGYWDIPHDRIFKYTPGMKYTTNHNMPAKPNGTMIDRKIVKTATTNIMCYHLGFAKDVSNMEDKTQYYINRGEGKEANSLVRQRRQMYVDCRKAWFEWKEGKQLPHGARVLPWNGPWPEVLKKDK
jgi:hypothetical protein